jgi:hypothetical protein
VVGDQDIINRGRSALKDSYGNPVQYDSLDDVDAQKPSKNKENPLMYVIPGYASGILKPHELPSRSLDDQEARNINDDRIHFIDPLNSNNFQSFDRVPSPSLTPPGITSSSSSTNLDAQIPIEIPRPNIDLNETPEVPEIDDPLNHPLNPPTSFSSSSSSSQDNTHLESLNTPPSAILEVPLNQDVNANPLFQDLVPPQIPSSSNGVDIPRPNLDIAETPIDKSDGPLNQGLLPPPVTSTNIFNNQVPPFGSNQNQDGPIVITDEQTIFAPKPANGLLPPKDPLPIDFQFDANAAIATTPSSIGFVTTPAATQNKFTVSSFGGSVGILNGLNEKVQPVISSQQIPVQIVQTQTRRPIVTNNNKVNKYTGNFGGSPGVLISNDANQQLPNKVENKFSESASTNNPHKFTGTFGGSLGVLGNVEDSNSNNVPQNSIIPKPTFTQNFNDNAASTSKSNNKYTGTFGGSPGVLQSFDRV